MWDLASVIGFLLGTAFGGALVGLILYRRSTERILSLSEENATLRERTSQLALFEQHIGQTLDSFSQRALHSSSSHLIQLTKTELDAQQGWLEQTTRHVTDRLRELERSLRILEENRRQSEGSLGAQITSLAGLTKDLTTETRQLRSAISSPRTAGRWGEVQLRNAVEAAGLIQHCDFIEQSTVVSSDQDGKDARSRPDLIIKLPSGKCLVIDAKAPLQTILSLPDETQEASRTRVIKEYATALRRYIRSTSQRDYPSSVPHALPFIAIFVPSESLLSLALQGDPDLLGFCDQHKTFLCTPLSLIAYLHTVSLGWQEQNLLAHASEIRELAQSLYDQLDRFTGAFELVGRSISTSVRQYNEACGIFERKLLPSAKRFRSIEGDKESSVAEPRSLEQNVRMPASND